jgi:hypothetical protein
LFSQNSLCYRVQYVFNKPVQSILQVAAVGGWQDVKLQIPPTVREYSGIQVTATLGSLKADCRVTQRRSSASKHLADSAAEAALAMPEEAVAVSPVTSSIP